MPAIEKPQERAGRTISCRPADRQTLRQFIHHPSLANITGCAVRCQIKCNPIHDEYRLSIAEFGCFIPSKGLMSLPSWRSSCAMLINGL